MAATAGCFCRRGKNSFAVGEYRYSEPTSGGKGLTREPDTDFDFDFFEEPSTQETAVQQRRALKRGPRRPVRPPPGFTPLLRLVGLIAFAILAVVVLVFVIQGCRDESKTTEYRTYMNDVSGIARESDDIGSELNKDLTTPGTKQADLVNKLSGLAQRQQQLVQNAQTFDAPGRLVTEQQALVDALQFRVSGLRGLEDGLRATANAKDANAAGRLLAAQAQRFVASDVVWDDLFKDPARAELRSQGIGGVRVPDSTFLVNPDLANANTMKSIWQGLHGAQTGGAPSGLHGDNIVGTKVVAPQATELSTSTETVIVTSTELTFEVTVENSGQFQESGVQVTMTIQGADPPSSKTATVDIIGPGEQKTVSFRGFGEPPIGEPAQIRVDVKPVPGERNTSNNSAKYPVIFSLTPP